ncbi:hypothetical protein L1049_012321 [Liquidambar formosana]|uniref:Two-component response regulator-like PRR37 n=1 Tax=Liquidambar formosana TaxID=63359 RepID=A0AAP0RSY5_LIQFO
MNPIPTRILAVTAVANGLQAWKLVEDPTTHIDLVLTEVVMPCLSGIGLLSKIMSHKTCQNIPVIMMSSHDSMGIVFKCLSKGAIDFLVKPIRKNELKNLWQHVWRKFYSSNGSGSESGIRTQKSAKSKGVEESDNNNGSDDEDDNRSIGLNARDGSDHGSGTQSSWTKRAVEVDSPQPMSPWEQLADPPDSTCAPVIHSRPEAYGNNWEFMTATRECQEQDDELDYVAMGKDLKIGVSRNPNLLHEDPSEKIVNNTAGTNKDKFPELNSKKDDEQFKKEQIELNGEKPNGELRNQAADLMGIVTNSTDPQVEDVVFEISSGLFKLSEFHHEAIYDNKEMPSLELGLKRLRDVGDNGTNAQHRNVLRHSDLSAFSRYNSASTANQAPTGNVGSCSPLDKSSEAAKTESIHNFHSDSNGTPNQRSNGSSNNNDMGSTTDNAFTKQAAFNDKPVPKSTVNCPHPSAFQPVKKHQISPLQPIIPDQADAANAKTLLAQAKGIRQQVQVQHHHHHYHHHHHHVHNTSQQRQQPNHDDLTLKNMPSEAPQCGSSSVLRALMNGNAGNHSLNGSTSGSNQGSNGQNGSTIFVNNGEINMESDNGIAGKDGAGGISGCGSRSGVDQNRFAQRVAALNKFRQKRKDRCFEKKVRYQSRKRLAEQRPRVRGQFVRQVVDGNKSEDTDC